MKYSSYFAAIEAMLFASGEPVAADRLCEVLELEENTLHDLMLDLMGEYDDKRGLQILRLNDSYQLCTKTAYAGQIKALLELKRNTPLSQAAMEVLAIIAYNQPVTKSFVERVRGVDSSSTVNSLVERELLEEAGRLDLPGRPIAYRTSDIFLRSFGMQNLNELPPLPEDDGQVRLEEVTEEPLENEESETVE